MVENSISLVDRMSEKSSEQLMLQRYRGMRISEKWRDHEDADKRWIGMRADSISTVAGLLLDVRNEDLISLAEKVLPAHAFDPNSRWGFFPEI